MMQLIVEDSKNKKKWLMGMLLRSLLQLRDALMATISLHLMGVDECKAICEEAGDQVSLIPVTNYRIGLLAFRSLLSFIDKS